MHTKSILSCLLATRLSTSVSGSNRPIIVVNLSDDQGYADYSFNPHHPHEVSTPPIDALAQESIFFSQAFVSGNVCSPTPAGCMLGQYQHRVGVYDAGTGVAGFDPTSACEIASLDNNWLDQMARPANGHPKNFVDDSADEAKA